MVTELIKPQYGVVIKVVEEDIQYNLTGFFNTTNLTNWIKDSKYKNIIITTRTDSEINHPKWCPHFNVIENLKKILAPRQRVYQFIQDPWPEPLLDIDIDDETFVLRFAYNEGDELDRTFREWEMEDGMYLLTNEEVVLI